MFASTPRLHETLYMLVSLRGSENPFCRLILTDCVSNGGGGGSDWMGRIKQKLERSCVRKCLGEWKK
jgi:hypothetical protein